MTDTRLKNCPFCGGEAEIWRASADPKRPAWVGCMGRCAVLVSREYETTEEAIAAWNRRTPPAAVPDGWRDALEHVTELLVDTWHHQMDGDPEEQIAVKDARALLATLALSVPEGWVLVPKEPTREMAIAAAKALDDITVDDPKAAAWDAMRAYRAMLSAAPTPPVDDGAEFKVGDRVRKVTGDYQIEGVVIGTCQTSAGKVRYVVEHTADKGGFLHIYSAQNLRRVSDA